MAYYTDTSSIDSVDTLCNTLSRYSYIIIVSFSMAGHFCVAKLGLNMSSIMLKERTTGMYYAGKGEPPLDLGTMTSMYKHTKVVGMGAWPQKTEKKTLWVLEVKLSLSGSIYKFFLGGGGVPQLSSYMIINKCVFLAGSGVPPSPSSSGGF